MSSRCVSLSVFVVLSLAVLPSATPLTSGQPLSEVPWGAVGANRVTTTSRNDYSVVHRKVDAGDFYWVGDHKVRLLRSLEKVAVRHAPGQAVAIRRRIASGPLMMKRLVVDRELAQERMLVLATPGISTSDELRETMDQLGSQEDVDRVTPVYINEESGLEMIPTERFIVKLAPSSFVEDLEALNDLLGVAMVRPLRGATDQFILRLPDCTPEELLLVVEFYAEDPAVEWAQPDFLSQCIEHAVTPTDTYYAQQWHLNNTGQSGGRHDADVDAAEAWETTKGSSEIVIAVLDDGVDLAHEDLHDNLLGNSGEIANNDLDDDNNGYVDDRNGWDFYSNDEDPSHAGDDDHGTSVAGVAAATGNNDKGVAGCAFECRLMPVKVDEGHAFRESDMAEAIRYAAGFTPDDRRWRGADVLNISKGFSSAPVIDEALHDAAVNGRDGKGCVVFCSSGNEAGGWKGPFTVSFEGGYFSSVTFRWEYTKDASGTGGDDTVWLDTITFPDGIRESFEQGLPATWYTGGSGSSPRWTSVTNGVGGNHAMYGCDGGSRAIRAGTTGDSGYSYVEVTRSFEVPAEGGTLSFWAWPSCERENLPTKQGDGLRLIVEIGASEYVLFSEDDLISDAPEIRTTAHYPASHPDTIAVGASTNFDFRADYSCYGTDLHFVAPGGGGSADIWTTVRTGSGDAGGNYRAVRGTSVASPLAAGVAALMLSKNPDLTAQEIRDIMCATCDKVDSLPYTNGRNDYYGYGRINAKKALDAVPSAGAQYPLQSTVLTFDDTGTGDNPSHMPGGYGGLSWSGSFCVYSAPAGDNTGYTTGKVSPDYVAYNGDGVPVEVSGGPFDFLGAHLAAAHQDRLNIAIEGYRSEVSIYSLTVTVNLQYPTWIWLGYKNVDRVTFTPTPSQGLGYQFVMDNMVINRPPVAFTGTTVLTFDDTGTGDNPSYMPGGYGGLSWSGSFCVYSAPAGDDSGYATGKVSPDYVAYNGGGVPVEVGGGPFDFVGAHLAAAGQDRLNIAIEGYRSEVRIYSRTVIVNRQYPTWIWLGYENVDRVTFTPTPSQGLGYQFVMDNMVINRPPVASTGTTVLTFDDTGTGDNPSHMPGGYGGLSWSGSFCVYSAPAGDDSGYATGKVSPDYVAYNGDGVPVEVGGGPFDFVGAHLAAAGQDRLNIAIEGYRSEVRIYSRTVIVNRQYPTWIWLGYENVDRVTFTPTPSQGPGYQFVMDNMVINR